MDIFFGRFHPLIVHFPIALLTLAAAVELLSRVYAFRRIAEVQRFILLFGAISALVSIVLGFMIAGDRGYDSTTLEWHRYLAIAVFLVSSFLYFVEVRVIVVTARGKLLLFALLLALITATGHFGGSLTHGDTYLFEFAPKFIRNLGMPDSTAVVGKLPDSPDSLIVYKEIIVPILVAGCVPCHDESQKKGGLVLTTIEGIKAGGEGGPEIKAGRALESELFKRITLPPKHSKFMPLKKQPLSFASVSLIRWWIDEGASFDKRLSKFNVGEDIRNFMIRDFHYDPYPKPYYEITRIDSVKGELVEKLTKDGFIIRPLSRDNNYLSVSLVPGQLLTLEMLDALFAIKDNVTWLDLGGKSITDQHLQYLATFTNLTRLSINNNPVSDEGIKSLKDLSHLESLNVFNTQITDEAILTIADLPALRRIYLWQTKVTPGRIEALAKERPMLIIDSGFQFQTPSEP